jgi:hypothetical protein
MNHRERLELVINYLIKYIELNPSWEANTGSATQQAPSILWNLKFITGFRRARLRFQSWATWNQSASPHPISQGPILKVPSHISNQM